MIRIYIYIIEYFEVLGWGVFTRMFGSRRSFSESSAVVSPLSAWTRREWSVAPCAAHRLANTRLFILAILASILIFGWFYNSICSIIYCILSILYTYICMCIYIYTHINLYTYVNSNYTYVIIYACIYIYIHMYIHPYHHMIPQQNPFLPISLATCLGRVPSNRGADLKPPAMAHPWHFFFLH